MASHVMVFSLLALGALFSYTTTVIFLFLFVKYFLLKSQTSIEIQDSLKFYIFIEVVNGFVVCFSLTHSCIVYHIRDSVIYVTPLLFWDGAVRNITVILRPIAVLILGIDRLFIILFPTMAECKRKLFPFSIGVSLMFVSGMLFSVYSIIPHIPTEIFTTDCVVFNCVGRLGNSSMYFVIKTLLGFADFTLAIILLTALKRRYKMMNITRIKNKNVILVMLTLLITVMLNFLPNIFGLLFLFVSC